MAELIVGGSIRLAEPTPLKDELGDTVRDDKGNVVYERKPVLDEDGKPVIDGGTKIIVVDRLPAKDFFPLHRLLRWYSDGHFVGDRSFKEDIGPYVGIVTAWDFPGDPLSLSAWLDLDIVTELPQLIGTLNSYLVSRLESAGSSAKN